MKPIKWGGIAAAMALLVSSVTMFAQDSGALIDALVKKGVITDQEGEEIRASEEKEWAQSPASKINVSSFIKNIQLYGDLRLRFESRIGDNSLGGPSDSATPGLNTTTNTQEKDRWRYRLRVGIQGDLYDNFFFGLRLSSAGANQRSGNVTFGSSGGKSDALGGGASLGNTGLTANGGPFAHNNGVGWDQLYLGWKPTDWVTLEAGQIPNPFYTTNLVWDDNLSPTGFAEKFSQKVLDNDTEVFANAGQFLYDADQTNDGAGSSLFLLEEQIGIKHKFSDDMSFKGAIGAMTYSGAGGGTGTDAANLVAWGGPANQPVHFNGTYTGFSPYSDVYSVNNLAILEMPFEFNFKIQKDWIPMKLYGDFAYNLQGSERSEAAQSALKNAGPTGNNLLTTGTGTGGTGTTAGLNAAGAAEVGSTQYQTLLTNGGKDDVKAYQIGMQFNDLKKKGDWMTKVYWNHTEYFAVDPNLTDADIFDARQNMEGIVLKASYNLTDSITLTGQFANANRIDKDLSAPGTGQDLSISSNHYQLAQFDAVWKF